VVFTPALSAPGNPAPSVPITPASFRSAAIHWLHEVLPLVPVTPHTQSDSDGRP
jgi:hypothetical protein